MVVLTVSTAKGEVIMMEYSDSLRSAFGIVSKYDPALYQRMNASDWKVGLRFGVLAQYYPDGSDLGAEERESAAEAFGTTQANLSDRTGVPGNPPETYMNMPLIREWSVQHGVPADYFTAAVLAHEFRHTSQNYAALRAEEEAFPFGARFAAKLPPQYGEPIVRESREDLWQIEHQ